MWGAYQKIFQVFNVLAFFQGKFYAHLYFVHAPQLPHCQSTKKAVAYLPAYIIRGKSQVAPLRQQLEIILLFSFIVIIGDVTGV
jgi:hypothetical protein